MLQVLFGDDEHTGEIGPYQRLMKNRKWVILGSAGMLACTSGLYDPVAQKATVKVMSLPLATLETALALGLGYMLVQNLLLLGQLFTCYKITLADRFSERRAEERTAATSRYHEAQKQLALIERADLDNAQATTDRLMASANAAQGAYNKAQATLEGYSKNHRAEEPEAYANVQATKEDLSRAQSELQKHLSSSKSKSTPGS